ncbi:cell envelope integrity EipB family protein [Nisaea acidiphila]|uniref:Cell envelope integrity EipB family protein n=1 Tax=Nisaea acidiphila TaxID=1862145 RepID=A0A9J7ATB3_9PROT|nr:cell envelope integrity EipB family protein [Nisaea acidiphila]UUX50931.1 cell envelope integrity EipB family protein [Nisaea acidiphila]
MKAISKAAIAIAAALIAGFAPTGQAEAGAAERIVPHKALYKLSLKRSAGNSDIVGVGGQMSFEWRDSCDGWTVNQRNLMILQSVEGSFRSVDSVMSTWEAKDGSSYRFLVNKDFGEGGKETIEGKAVRTSSGTVAVAFSKPESVSMELPADIIFPSAHTLRLLDSVLTGEKLYSASLFDGSEFEAESFVSAAIGRKKIAELGDDPLLSGSYWPLRLAFFGPGNSSEAPDYELTVQLHANGIARGLEIHFDDFTVDVTLQRLEKLPDGGC